MREFNFDINLGRAAEFRDLPATQINKAGACELVYCVLLLLSLIVSSFIVFMDFTSGPSGIVSHA